MFLLAGCPKKSAELQGAPPEGQHVMPGGKTMSDDQMNPPAPTPAAATGQDDETASCLVLGTTMAKKDMIAHEYQGKTYYFCCPPCVEKFKQDPEKWIQNPTPAKPMGEAMQ
jgi:YHS domain-containing protein